MTGAGPSPAPAEGGRSWRWVIVFLIFLGTVVNYIDRQAVAVLAPVLLERFHFSNEQYAVIGSSFLFAYAFAMWIWGWAFDRIGNRLGYAFAVAIWSASEIAHAFVGGLGSFSVARAGLGVGESGNWPGATRTVAAWFAAKQRALGMGIANAGASLGPMVAAPLIVAVKLALGWRAVFVATGCLGLVWLALWLAFYPRRADGPASTGRGAPPPEPPVPWPFLFRQRAFWGIVAARFFGDPIWWLYLFWLPLYLTRARGFSFAQLGVMASLPYVAAAAGALSGGWLSGHLIHRGWSVNAARKTALVAGAGFMVTGIAAAYAASAYVALAFVSLTLFGFQFWVGNVQTLPSDFFPVGAVGSIAGFSGTAAAVGAMLLTASTGWIVDRFSYVPVLVIGGLLAPVATLAVFVIGGPVRRLPAPAIAGSSAPS